MRYLPTLDIWNPAIQTALQSGQLRLQPGQWITCGPDASHKSRFHFADRRGYIRAFHGPDASRNFLAYVAGRKEAQGRFEEMRRIRLGRIHQLATAA